jgi:CRP-like cAMP-binding protein
MRSRTGYVRVVTQACVAEVSWKCAQDLLSADHALSLAWLEDLAFQFLHTADTVKQVIFGDLTARIVNVLLSYADALDEHTNTVNTATVDISHHQIAEHVASPRRSVIRAMRQLNEDGLVAQVEGKLVLLDLRKLEQKLHGPRIGMTHSARLPIIPVLI